MYYNHHCRYCDRVYDIPLNLSDSDIRVELEKRLIKKQNDLINAPVLEEIQTMTLNFNKQLDQLKKKLR